MTSKILLHAPFDFHYEVDIRRALKSGAGTLSKERNLLLSLVRNHFPEYAITAPNSENISAGTTDHDGKHFHSRHNRLPYLLSVLATPDSEFFSSAGLDDSRFQVRRISWSAQEYGFGTIEIELHVSDGTCENDSDFLAGLIGACNTLDPICQSFLSEFFSTFYEIVAHKKKGPISIASDAALLTHRSSFSFEAVVSARYAVATSWFHATLVGNHSQILDEESGPSTLSRQAPVLLDCTAPDCKKPYRYFFGWNHVVQVNFLSRTSACGIYIGWGNSALVYTGSHRKHLDSNDGDIPLSDTMHMAHSFSAAISNLNYHLLREAYLLESTKNNRITEYRQNAERLENLQYRSSLFLSLIDEQRSSLNPGQRAIWNACARAWMLDDLEDDLRKNTSMLKDIYALRRNILQDTLRRRLEYSLAIISVASASAIVIEIIKNFSAPIVDYQLVAWQLISVFVMIVLALILFISPRKRPDIEA